MNESIKTNGANRGGWRPIGTLLGLFSGAATGSSAGEYASILSEQKDTMIAIVGGAVGLLAVVLAIITLSVTLLSDAYGDVIIGAGETKNFFNPFIQAAIVSGAAATTGMAGLILTGFGPVELRAALFAIAVFLFVWAIVAAIRLVFIFLSHALNRAELENQTTDVG